MAQVTVVINNRKYDIACDDGQEKHLTNLAQYVDGKVSDLVASVGQVGDARLLVMTSLLVADELSDVYSELSKINEGKTDTGMFGINIHKAGTVSSFVENWSEGCQVFKRVKDFNEFMAIVNKAKDIHGNHFTYTLIESNDI